VGDFLGVGGLGYFELPGAYSRPDPSEQLLLPALEPLDGAYRLDVLEPLEECTYLDALSLVAVDSPAGVSVIPEEMFAIRGPQPVDRLLAFRERVFAARAEDGRGRDVTAALRDVDRIYGNEVVVDTRFPGLARRPHAITLDFADGAARVVASGPAARPYLFLHGYVEYGYSTSNFAAWQARESFRAPTVLAERDGKWEPLREEWGFPAGTPRYMTVDLTGRLAPGDRRLRVETNMEIHWDQAFLADASAVGDLRVTELQADTAALGFRGYPPEESPDGKLPLVYAYRDFVPSIGYKDFPGDYTRYGDVRDLLVAADDRFAVFGPGDGLALSFRAAALPALPAGWKRTFVARAFGYCKDMDLYTAHPDRVEPLPFRGMSGYPYGAAEAYPSTDPHARYRREWNTRRVGEETHGEGNDLPRR
jgi:hypothetical protein